MSSHIGEIPSPEYRPSVIQDTYDMITWRPHAIALTDGDLEWAYADLRRRSDIVARSLTGHGITRAALR